MSKGPRITENVQWLVARVYNAHKGWTAKQIRAEVDRQLHDGNLGLRRNWPGLSSVQKCIAEIKKKDKKLPNDPENGPWSVVTIAQYPIPPEALPVVLKAYMKKLKDKDDSLTIRQARWIGRLFHTVQDVENLDFAAYLYAENEETLKLTGEYRNIQSDVLLYSYMTGKDYGDCMTEIQ